MRVEVITDSMFEVRKALSLAVTSGYTISM